MAIIQGVKNGQIVDPTGTAKEKQTTEKKSTGGSSLDKDAFLQLLVAQMKYQDPLEPTDNTESVSQLATFSQLEETQNQTNVIREQTASSLIGKNVIIHSTDATTGSTQEDMGVVDYVQKEGSKIYVYVNGNQYDYDDVYQVLGDDYMDATNLASSFAALVSLLPNESNVQESSRSALQNAQKVYNAMSSYQKSFIDDETKQKLDAVIAAFERQFGKLNPDSTKNENTDTSKEEETKDTTAAGENNSNS